MPEAAHAPPAQAVSTPSFKLGFMKFVVRDLPAMVDFYERALGLKVTGTIELPELIEQILQRPGDQGGFALVLYFNKDGRDVSVGNAHGPLGLYVRDVDAAYAHAVGQGATPHRGPFEVGESRVAFVLDPEGRELEFVSVIRR